MILKPAREAILMLFGGTKALVKAAFPAFIILLRGAHVYVLCYNQQTRINTSRTAGIATRRANACLRSL
jgi:hypothetical protein